MRLEARHLELLLAVDRAGSVSAAARALGIDQPQLTRQLRRIESHLGFAVFDRAPTGVRPTVAGADVLERARVAVRALLDVDVARCGPDRASVHVLYQELDPTPAVAALHRHRPGSTVTTAQCSTVAEGRAELLAGSADLLVAPRLPGEPWPATPALREIVIGVERAAVFLLPGHPAAGPGEVDLGTLADPGWLVGGHAAVERLLDREHRRIVGRAPRVVFRTRDAAPLSELSRAGAGVVFGLRSGPWRTPFVRVDYRSADPVTWMLLHRPAGWDDGALPVAAEALRALLSGGP